MEQEKKWRKDSPCIETETKANNPEVLKGQGHGGRPGEFCACGQSGYCGVLGFHQWIWMVEVSTVNAGNPQPEQEGADLSEEASETTHQFFWK